jgi:hypothetical protein
MCTLVGKLTHSKLIVIGGTPCCLQVEEIQAINPKISRDNGWEEIHVDEIVADLPAWTHWTFYKEKGHLPANLPQTTPDGRRLVWIDLEEDVRMHFPEEPVAQFTYRGATIHFRDWDRVKVLRSFVADTLRRISRYPGHERFLRMIPSAFLGQTDRSKVVKKLDRLLKEHNKSVS